MVSGKWRVEECGGGDGEEGEERVRRLVFVKTAHLVQTEMRLIPGRCACVSFCMLCECVCVCVFSSAWFIHIPVSSPCVK